MFHVVVGFFFFAETFLGFKGRVLVRGGLFLRGEVHERGSDLFFWFSRVFSSHYSPSLSLKVPLMGTDFLLACVSLHWGLLVVVGRNQ